MCKQNITNLPTEASQVCVKCMCIAKNTRYGIGSTMTELVKLFHRDLYDKEELSRCAKLFFIWKKEVDKQFCQTEYTMSDLKDAHFLSRCCGRERSRLFHGGKSTLRLEYAMKYRLNNSILRRFLELLKCFETNDEAKLYVYSLLEMFRITFIHDVNEQRKQQLPASKRWMIDFISNEVKSLVTNTFDQAHHGLMPAFRSVDRVRSLFTQIVLSPNGPTTKLTVPCFGITCDMVTKRRVNFFCKRLRKSREIQILTKRVSPSIITPPTSPIPDTSDGVGSMT